MVVVSSTGVEEGAVRLAAVQRLQEIKVRRQPKHVHSITTHMSIHNNRMLAPRVLESINNNMAHEGMREKEK